MKQEFLTFCAATATLLVCGCAITPFVAFDRTVREPPPMQSPMVAPPFSPDEALSTIEFCLDLDAQDDAQAFPTKKIFFMVPERTSMYDFCYDSRTAVIADKVRAQDPRIKTDADKQNPILNGFGSFDSAWTLWKKHGENVFIIAMRGTIFRNRVSVAEDLLAGTVAANRGLEFPAGHFLDITYATLPRAEVHSGFAYGSFECLFDASYGILCQLETNPKCRIPAGSTLIITGHSQGAALATLTHAFFHYAAQKSQFGIREMGLTLRSYVFAQPKPGNVQFAEDFQNALGGTSFVFNNTLDAVPFLPPTRESLLAVFADCPKDSDLPGWPIVREMDRFNENVDAIASLVTENTVARKVIKLHTKGGDEIYRWKEGWLDISGASSFKPTEAVSQNYVTAGLLIPLYGTPFPEKYFGNPADANDTFIQHHSQTYRELLESLLSAPHLPAGCGQTLKPAFAGSFTAIGQN